MALMYPEEFKYKRDALARSNDPRNFRQTIGPQMLYLSNCLIAMKDERLWQIGDGLRVLFESSVNGGKTTDAELAGSMERLSRLPKLLAESGNADLSRMQQVMDEHPEYKDILPEQVRDKSLLDHLRDVDKFMELGCEPSFKRYEEQLKADAEQRRQAEEKQEQERRLEEERRQKFLAERQAFRQENGAFAYPTDCDAHDAAGMFYLSGQQNGSEYQALQSFCKALGDRLDEREQFVEDETLKRTQEFDSKYPSDAAPETQQELIQTVMDSISLEDKESNLNNWYPDGLEEPIAKKQKELGTTDRSPALLQAMYADAMAVQYKNALREKRFGKGAIEDAMRTADRELAQEKIEALSKGTAEDKELLRRQRERCRSDIIARRFKEQMIDAFRPSQKAILDHFCHRPEDKNRYRGILRKLNPTNEELYKAVMNDWMDKSLVNKELWDEHQEGFCKRFGTPKGMEGRKEPFTDMLQQVMHDPELEKQVDLELPDSITQLISHEELDRRVDQKLGFQAPGRDALLYEWARDTQKLRIRNDILIQREKEFRDVTQDNVAELTRLYNNLRDVVTLCKPSEQAPTAEMLAGKVKKAAAALDDARDTLCDMPTKDGKIGEALNALDQAWTNADFAPGKEVRTRSGIEPDAPIGSANPSGKTAKTAKIYDSTPSINIALERHWSTKPPASKKYIFKDEQQLTRKPEQEEEQLDDLQNEDLDVTFVDNDPAKAPDDVELSKHDKIFFELETKLSPKYPNSQERKALIDSYIKLDQHRDDLWKAWQNEPNMPRETRDKCLADCLAATLQMQRLKDGEPVPTDEKSLSAASEAVQNSLAFKLLKDDLSRGALKLKEPDAMARPYQEKQREEHELEHRHEVVRSRMKPIQTALENTRRGTILFFPRVGLLGNSQNYIDALNAIRRGNEPNLDAKTLYEDRQTVMTYLDDKMKVRSRPFGKERWKQCMTYLKNTMPRKEFQAYCDKVNAARGVAGKPLSAKFVSPQDFGPTNYKEAEDELLADVRSAEKPELEDYAALIALRSMPRNEEVNRRFLSVGTREVMQDKTFQWLAKNPEKLKSYVEGWKIGDLDYIAKFQKEAEKDAAKEEQAEPVQPQNPEPKKLGRTK